MGCGFFGVSNMSGEEEAERGTDSFTCIDPIQNFKIRVVLKSIKNRFVPVPHFDEEKSTSESSTTKEAESEIEEYTFSWQEKIFSKNELDTYSKISNCKTKIHEKYHEEVMKILKDAKVYPKKLFTYTDSDDFKLTEDAINYVHGEKGYVSFLAGKIANLEVSGLMPRHFTHVSKNKVVNFSPDDQFKKENHMINVSAQKMFLMADLGIKNSDEVKKRNKSSEEYVLCIITYDPVHKLLKMSPSFSKEVNTKPYFVRISGQNSSNAYHYWLHHASLQASEEELNNEKRMRNKISQHQSELRKLKIGNEFFGQYDNHISVTILGEISTAEDFEYDNLSVHYLANLPNGWSCSAPETLGGMTHTSRTNQFGVAHFCHLFTIQLMFDLKHLQDFSAFLPEIFLQVLSMDAWKIYRNEGYSYVTLPRKPGIYSFNLTCWRATDSSLTSEMDRFFLGGSQVLEHVSYAGSGSRIDNKRITSRFGLKTVPSGSLQIKLNVLHQSEGFKMEKDGKGDFHRDIFSRFDTADLLGSVDSVLEAFRQARERMLKAKERLESEPDS